MSDRYVQSVEDLQHQFYEQLRFLKNSANSFDSGFEAEAKQLALRLRVLLHHTGKSRSLLSQLQKGDIAFLDTSDAHSRGGVNPYSGLLFVAAGPPHSRFIAPLDDYPWSSRWIPFEEWWAQPIFVDDKGREISRRSLVLTAANQDGGAHVDPTLDPVYADLAKKNSLAWFAGDERGMAPIPGPELVAIRQIAHEVLKTLQPGYSKKVEQPASMIVGGVSVRTSKSPTIRLGPSKPKRKIGRNEACPCGSGKKFKHCHGGFV